jgi:hypothetical protein
MLFKTYKFEALVLPGGKVELTTPLREGSRVEVLVMVRDAEEAPDLTDAAASSTALWERPIDMREGNDA